MEPVLDRDTHLRRLHFRAWHRGTKEADLLIGGFFDRFSANWDTPARDWFEGLLAEDDVDIMAWAIGTQVVPARWAGPMMTRMQALDYIPVPK
jgi:antitoxin CptB